MNQLKSHKKANLIKKASINLIFKGLWTNYSNESKDKKRKEHLKILRFTMESLTKAMLLEKMSPSQNLAVRLNLVALFFEYFQKV
jgi:hypothetical protein